jgi:hypothetical protein
MKRLMRDGRLILGLVLLSAGASRAAAQPAGSDSAGLEFFEKKVRPVLVEHCYKCHSAQAKKVKGGLLLDSREGLLKGGDTGPALVPGKPEQSRLIEAIGYKNVDLQMPSKGKLPDSVIADLTRWVQTGAAWPSEKTSASAIKATLDVQARKQRHWAWQPLQSPPLPTVQYSAWVREPVDAFILSRLESKHLKPTGPADRRTLLRRVTFDLIGLPPTPAEIEAFVRDESPLAFARVVDRLLASPHFGERWGRHWLDLVRYAESRGHELDYTTPNACQYRDYIIRALNADVPYDQIVTEHLAGDLLERPRLHPRERFNESILGTGFWFLGEEVHSPVDTRQDEADRFDNRIDVMTKTFLGLTVSCARCHDHKFDAISSKDYYALFAFLESSSYRLARFDSLETNRRVAAELARWQERTRPELQRVIAASLQPTVARLADYLLAAREAAARSPSETSAIAEARRLNPEVLAAWVRQLAEAGKDVEDPFYLWAHVVADPATRSPRRFRDVLTTVADGLKQCIKNSESVPANIQVVVDYSRVKAPAWMPDGCSFGCGPRQPGEVLLNGDGRFHLVERGAAVYDRAWDGLRAAPGAENDPSAVGRTIRAGRTIRTPSFTLTNGKVFYLVRGQGQAYAAVGQHTLINGPLHAQLVKALDTKGAYQWVAHDLTPYQGQLTHIEFTALAGHDLEIAQVIQAEQPPRLSGKANLILTRVLGDGELSSLQALAERYQRLFAEAAGGLTKDASAGSIPLQDCARLVNWALAHPDLFKEGCENLRQASERLGAERKRILRDARLESRLALAMLDGSGVDERVFVRGSPKALGEPAPRRFLEALAGPTPLPIARGSGRLELARQMTDPAINPLLPRVLINRVWHHLFGRGIVASVDNFGVLGELPTHPELLDYLASRLVQEGWSVKKLVRELVLSNTYQMASQAAVEADQADPQDLLLHRMRVRRLEGEAIRDAMLAVSGRLEEKLFGPSVPVNLTPFLDGRGKPASGPLDGDGRRSLYLAVRRNFLSPFLLTFDTPIPFSTVGRRSVSNVPAQALILLNDPFVHQQAEVWARRVLAQPGSTDERIAKMYTSAFAREPTASELEACRSFLEQQARLHAAGTEDMRPWKDLAHTLFNVKEFIYLN